MPVTTPRRDAARNRARILDAARATLAAGEPLQLNAVAHRAEVGVGTVYRHFPTPEALREGLVEHRFTELIALAAAVGADDDPGAALRRFLADALGVYAADPEFAAVTTSASAERPETAELRAELQAAFGTLVDRAATRLRPGYDGTDLLVLVCGLGYSARLRPARASAYIDALLDGLLR